MTPDALTAPLVKRLPRLFGAIRFQETVFALPFAYTGTLLASDGLPTLHDFLWITVAMVGARTLGMSANRLIDRHIDARNPRTAGRHLPQGSLAPLDLIVLAAGAFAVLLIAAAQLNTLALVLAPVAGAYLVAYPYAKRFTWASNLLLGWGLAIAPAAAWMGVRGTLSWEVVVLSLAVAAWAGSFDIIYHAQDVKFYADNGLHSVAQQFGVRAAFNFAKVLDVVAVAALITAGLLLALSPPYYAGCLAAVALLVVKHRLVSPTDLSRMGIAFFRINAFLSAAVFMGTLGAVAID